MDRAVIYARISRADEETQTSTQRQIADCETLAAARGWRVEQIYEDVNISAFKRGKVRPEFERMLKAVKAGEVDRILAYHIDRITRDRMPFARLMDACADVGASIVTVSDHLDTSTSMGEFGADMLVSHARMSSQDASRRLKRKERERALQGLPSGGGTRAFGYEPGYKFLVPEEAGLVREAARRVLSGESLRGISVDWKERGVRSSTGKVMAPNTIGRMLKSPTWSGQREVDGQMVKGQWRAILKPEETARLRAILSDASRLSRGPGGTYLLTGLAKCGRCSTPLHGRPTGNGARRYVCGNNPERANCGGITRLADPVEEMVLVQFFEQLDHLDLEAPDATDDTKVILEQLQDLEGDLGDLAHEFRIEKAIPRSVYLRQRDELNAKIHHLRRPLAKKDDSALLSPLTAATARGRKRIWASKPLDWKKSVLAALIDEVVIYPAVKGSRDFDPSKIVVNWRA